MGVHQGRPLSVDRGFGAARDLGVRHGAQPAGAVPHRRAHRSDGQRDNQSNGFTLDKLCSTKFPLYLVLMELSEQLRSRQLVLSVAWRPRDENEEADALTNERFGAFSLDRRVHVKWSDLRFSVLPRLTDQAVRHFEELQKLKAAARRRPHSAQATRAKRGRLMETDPW